jgi:NodT family efflux transporter outer membrane factor (OMF) lipoprotein
MRRGSLALAVVVLCTSCRVGPNYKRPAVAAPPQFRAAQTPPEAVSLGDAKWFDVFQDDVLRGLIKEALAANYDVRIAAQRVIDSQGQLEATRSRIFPQVGVQGAASRQGLQAPVQSMAGVFAGASWEIDLFGKLRRATEAAKADLLASEENQKAVMQALVAQVAVSYFTLREYDLELSFVLESIKSRSASYRLVNARLQGGVSTKLDLDQAESLVASAQAEKARLEQAIEQTENLINFLIGKQPGPVARGKLLTEQYEPPQVPAGLPSQLLDRRPDIRLSEQQLIAANARVGEAKAAFFPSITLTASGGYQTADLLGVISRTGTAYGLGGTIDLPIFDAGRRAGLYKSAKAQHEGLLINYEKSINSAFRDVSDALIGYQKSREYRVSQEQFTLTLRDQSRLSDLRYRGGVTSYLEVLDTERQRLTAEQQLAQAERDELNSLVRLYESLGGGWQ